MGIGSGISAQFGIAAESTPNTPVAVTRFFEFDSETLGQKKYTAQGAGLRAGALFKRGVRRILVAREAGGEVSLDVTTQGFGLILQQMLGSFSATAVSVGGGLFQQVHNPGQLQGHSFTAQVLKPDTSGTLTSGAYTYPGCKITEWELSVQQKEQLKLKLTIDAVDEATPSNGFAPTTLAALVTQGATSISTVATIPAGSYVVIGGGGIGSEVVLTGTPTGGGPFTIPIAAGVNLGHASGSSVGSATGVNYGAVTALQTASYSTTATLFGFNEGTLIAGGSTAAVSGVWTNTDGDVIGNVRTISIKGSNPVKNDRWGLGSPVKSEQIDNNWRAYTADVEVELNSRAFYDAYASDTPLALSLKFVGAGGSIFSIYAPVGFQGDGASPAVAGPDIIIQKLSFEILDDGTNGAFQATITSTDSTV